MQPPVRSAAVQHTAMERPGLSWRANSRTPLGLGLTSQGQGLLSVPRAVRGASVRCASLWRQVDVNEEKVKCVPPRPKPTETRPAPPAGSTSQTATPPAAPAAAAAAAVAGWLAAGPAAAAYHVDSQVYTPLDLTWGQPNEFLPHVIVRHHKAAEVIKEKLLAEGVSNPVASLQDGVHQAVNALLSDVEVPQAPPAATAAAAAAQQTINDLLHTALVAPTTAATQFMTSVRHLADQLVQGVELAWPANLTALPTPAAQLVTYVAAVLGAVVLLRLGTAPPSESKEGPGSGTGTSKAASSASWEAWAAQETPGAATTRSGGSGASGRNGSGGVVMRSTTPAAGRGDARAGAVAGRAGAPAAAVAAAPQPVPSLNPVQEAWHHFRTTPPVYRQASVEPAATLTARTASPPATTTRPAMPRSATPKPTRMTPTSTVTAAKTSTSASQLMQTLRVGNTAKNPSQQATVTSEDQATAFTREADSKRRALQEKLLLVSESLGTFLAVVPGGDSVRQHADVMLRELEALAPPAMPLQTQAFPQSRTGSVLGVWELVYATNDPLPAPPPPIQPLEDPQPATTSTSMGPVTRPKSTPFPSRFGRAPAPATTTTTTTSASPRADPKSNAWGLNKAPDFQTPQEAPPRPPGLDPAPLDAGSNSVLTALLHLAAVLPGFGLQRVEQRLWEDPGRPGIIVISNSSTFSLGPLGVWRVSATGAWRDTGDGHCAQGWFDSLALQPLRLLGVDTAIIVPQVVVALPNAMRAVSTWDTTYLDSTTRISRGSEGTVFLFQRVNATMPAAGAVPARQPDGGAEGWAGVGMARA